MNRAISLILLCLSLISAPACLAADYVNGEQNYHNVRDLTSQINWYTALPQAEWEAQRSGKLVFWVHMLGSLSGAT
jgi:hypothetical protein